MIQHTLLQRRTVPQILTRVFTFTELKILKLGCRFTNVSNDVSGWHCRFFKIKICLVAMINNLKTKNKGFDVLVGIGRPRPTGRYAEKKFYEGLLKWSRRWRRRGGVIWEVSLPSGLGGLRERRELPTWSRAEPFRKRIFSTFWVTERCRWKEQAVLQLNMVTI